jgi:hypothetical protein
MARTRTRRRRRPARLLGALVLAAGAVAAAAMLATRPPAEPFVHDEVEALARVIRSEAGTSPLQQRVHIAWATRNLAEERRQTIARMACSPCGPQQAGRPVSSRQAPTEGDRQLARQILAAPRELDATGGATRFVNPKLQDELAASGRKGYRDRPYHAVRKRWTEVYGWEPYYRLGRELELWGPRRVARR